MWDVINVKTKTENESLFYNILRIKKMTPKDRTSVRSAADRRLLNVALELGDY